MFVEPVPAGRPSPVRRVLRVVAIAAPPLLLAGVVAVGTFGPRTAAPGANPTAQWTPTTTSPGGGSPASEAGAPAAGDDPAGAGNGASEPEGRTATSSGIEAPVHPRVVAGLLVRTVSDALALRGAVQPNQVLAIAGDLGLPTPPDGCPAGPAGSAHQLCEWRGVLAERPWVTGGAGLFSPLDPHLHPRFPVGVRVPAAIARTTRLEGGVPVPVVLIGRFEPDGELCRAIGPACEARFLVDRVAWVDGRPIPPAPVLDVAMSLVAWHWTMGNQARAEAAAIGWAGTVLVSALVRPETVEAIDPEAGAALRAGPSPAGLVWYVRGLESGFDPARHPTGRVPPRLRWILLDDTTGRVLASGPAQLES